MKAFVFWTGIVSILSGAGLQLPALSAYLTPGTPSGMLLHVFGPLAIFLGVMLQIYSRDLEHRGVLVAWEGVLRLAAGALMAAYGIIGDAGLVAAAAGLGDFTVGVIYLGWLPRHLGVSLVELLFDRRSPVAHRDGRNA